MTSPKFCTRIVLLALCLSFAVCTGVQARADGSSGSRPTWSPSPYSPPGIGQPNAPAGSAYFPNPNPGPPIPAGIGQSTAPAGLTYFPNPSPGPFIPAGIGPPVSK